jgi:hypothetical protein
MEANECARDFYTDYLGLSVEDFNLGWVAHYRSSDGGAHIQLVTGGGVGGAPLLCPRP